MNENNIYGNYHQVNISSSSIHPTDVPTDLNGDDVDNDSDDSFFQNLYNEFKESSEFEEAEKLRRINLESFEINHEQRETYSENLYETISDDNISFDDSEDFATWEKYSNGFASKFLNKYGYNGGGLGKHEDGIITPVEAGSGTKHFSLDINEKYRKQKRVRNKTHNWPSGTTLITGSSILMGLEEKKLRKYNAKVRPFPGACVDDMFDYIIPLLKKKPTNIILHIGSNDAPFKSANDIAKEITNLTLFIENELPGVNILLSNPVLRLDDHKANNTLRKLSELFKLMKYNIIYNENVDASCLGKRGLHLNAKGSGRLAINFISVMRRL